MLRNQFELRVMGALPLAASVRPEYNVVGQHQAFALSPAVFCPLSHRSDSQERRMRAKLYLIMLIGLATGIAACNEAQPSPVFLPTSTLTSIVPKNTGNIL